MCQLISSSLMMTMIFAFAGISTAEDEPTTTLKTEVEYLGYASPEQPSSESRVRVLKEVDAAVLNDMCDDKVCRGFMYDDPSAVAYFEAKPAVRFTSASTYVFKKPPRFDVLIFNDSKFANFPLNLFHALKISELDMRNCSVQSLSWDNFLMADDLSILLLSENSLREIKPLTFNNAQNLAYLFLDSNEIATLHADSFKQLPNLYFLDLHDNRLETLPDEVFSYLPSLHQLHLAGNRLRVIADAIFLHNPRLGLVNMKSNQIAELGEYVFEKQEDMYSIDLSNNAPLQTLVGNMRVDTLWACNCSISRVNIYGKVKNVDLQKNHIQELYFSRPETLESLLLSDNKLPQIASLSKATNLLYLDLSNNPHLKALPEYWETDSLQELDLSNTSLTDIPLGILSASENLKILNVSNNLLTHIDPRNFQYFEKLNKLYLHRNNWNCYSLQLIMDMLIRPWKIRYNPDVYDDEFPGEYIGDIQCMYRVDVEEEEAEKDLSSAQNENTLGRLQQVEQASRGQESEVDVLRREFKTVVGIYDRKFGQLLKKVDDLDRRLRAFEQFNRTMWQHVTISV